MKKIVPTEPRRLIHGVACDCNINIAVRTENHHRAYIEIGKMESIRDRSRLGKIKSYT
jgi:hypothetical protein